MKRLLLTALVSMPMLLLAQGAPGEVIGTIVSAKGDPLNPAKIQTETNGTVYRGHTDIDGRFRISAIPSGQYDFTIIYSGDTMRHVIANVIPDGIDNLGNIVFTGKMLEGELEGTVVKGKIMKLTYGVAPEIKMTAEDIAHSPVRFDQKAMISAMTSDIKVSDDGELVFRGARKGDMIYMMDGVKVTEISNVPSASIGSMMVYTGGIPAKYGDTNGGVVVMETKSYFDLLRQWQISESRKE